VVWPRRPGYITGKEVTLRVSKRYAQQAPAREESSIHPHGKQLTASLKAFSTGPGGLPLPLVVIDTPDLSAATCIAWLAADRRAAYRTLSTQGQDIVFNDTLFKVDFTAVWGSGGQEVLIEVWAQARGHLTALLVATGRATLEEFKAFREMMNVSRSYTLTLSAEGSVRLDLLHLVKYQYRAHRLPH